jgi:recombination protein RecA
MPTAATLRRQIEASLSQRIPSALTPAPRTVRPVAATGIQAVDELLEGGLPIGAITEVVGPECSGRTSLALSFLARVTQTEKVCAWIDASNVFDPASAAAMGIDLKRLLWVRCGAQPTNVCPATYRFTLPQSCLMPPAAKKGLHGGGFGPHPRTETKGVADAVSGWLRPEATAPRCAEPQRRVRSVSKTVEPKPQHEQLNVPVTRAPQALKPWSRMEQALRATDLLLQAGGFSAIVLDMGSVLPEAVSRVPAATWFRYRAAAERTQCSIVLLTQHSCAKSSAELVLRLEAIAMTDEPTVFTGIEPCMEVVRRRFNETPGNVVPLRKPPQSAPVAKWQSRTVWAGHR